LSRTSPQWCWAQPPASSGAWSGSAPASSAPYKYSYLIYFVECVLLKIPFCTRAHLLNTVVTTMAQTVLRNRWRNFGRLRFSCAIFRKQTNKMVPVHQCFDSAPSSPDPGWIFPDPESRTFLGEISYSFRMLLLALSTIKTCS
jgi:hypothetical protein